MVVDVLFSLLKSSRSTRSSLVNLRSLKNNIRSPLSPFFSLLSPLMARSVEEIEWGEHARERESEGKR